MARTPHDAAIPTEVADRGQTPQVTDAPTPPGDAGTPPAAAPATTPAPVPEMRVGRTAASTTYVGIGIGLLVLVVILIVIIQNLGSASVHFFTANFHLPLGLVILASAVAGGLLVLLASAARVLQLRRNARRHRKADARAAAER